MKTFFRIIIGMISVALLAFVIWVTNADIEQIGYVIFTFVLYSALTVMLVKWLEI
jgi:hypothetical protein